MSEHRGVAPLYGLIALALAVLLLSGGIAAALFYTGGSQTAFGATATVEQQQSENGITQLRITVSSFGDADRVVIKQVDGEYNASLTQNSSKNFVVVGDGINDVSANESNDQEGGITGSGEEYDIYAVQDDQRRLIRTYTI